MPVMDGLEATREIRKWEPPLCRIPVIALTAGAFNEDRQHCEAAGMDDFLTKPFDAHKMCDVIRKWTKVVRKHHEGPPSSDDGVPT